MRQVPRTGIQYSYLGIINMSEDSPLCLLYVAWKKSTMVTNTTLVALEACYIAQRKMASRFH